MWGITSSQLQLFAYDLQIKFINAVNMASVQDLYIQDQWNWMHIHPAATCWDSCE